MKLTFKSCVMNHILKRINEYEEDLKNLDINMDRYTSIHIKSFKIGQIESLKKILNEIRGIDDKINNC